MTKRAWVTVTSGALLLGIVVRGVFAAPGAPAGRSARPSRSVWDSVYTDAQAGRGDTVYRQICSSCHGPALAGIDDAPPLAGKDFLSGWGGMTVGQLFGRIQRTMPGDNSVVLTPQQIADVVAYILRSNGFPAGQVELGLEQATLAAIRIEAARSRPDSSSHDSARGSR